MTITRKIGLSLGADECWPRWYEDLIAELGPIEHDGESFRFELERVPIEPFDLRERVDYDVVVDRLTHWYVPRREWIKKAILMDGVYVLNNPWSVQSMTKQTTYCAMLHLGLPIPDTVLVPPKDYEPQLDLRATLQRYAKLFDLGQLGARVGYPMFMKPYDGGAWVGVTKIDDEAALRAAYELSGTSLMHLQKGIVPYDEFVRCIGLGPQVRIVRYDPSRPHHERYRPDIDVVRGADAELLTDITLTINAFFGWDFNSCEAILQDGVWHPFDFANPCPDSQVTSLGVHFPWLVLAKIKWTLFCAATRRAMRRSLDWEPFYAVRERDGLSDRERIAAYAEIARERFDCDRFEAFCAQSLADLDALALDYLGSERAHVGVRKKVESMFPEGEWDRFTEVFWGAVQDWREHQRSEGS